MFLCNDQDKIIEFHLFHFGEQLPWKKVIPAVCRSIKRFLCRLERGSGFSDHKTCQFLQIHTNLIELNPQPSDAKKRLFKKNHPCRWCFD